METRETTPHSPRVINQIDKVISSFIPNILLSTLDANKGSHQLSSSSLQGVCLLAVIPDYTSFTESFSSKGKSGIDELQDLTNRYLGSLFEVIHCYGGDIIRFVDNTITVFFKPFDQSDESSRTSCANALQCSWELKEIVSELSLHMGICCGDICFGQLGGFENKWEFAMSGDCISELVQCLEDASNKSVIITADCFRCLTGDSESIWNFKATKQHSSSYLVESIDKFTSCKETFRKTKSSNILQLSHTSCYVSPIVTKALMTDTLDNVGDLRKVTVALIKWEGYDKEDYKDLKTFQNFFYACQKIVSDSGGFIYQVIVGEKVFELMVVWGVAAAGPDDCRLALGTCIRVRTKLLDMNMPCSSGITSGTVYCGIVGSEVRKEYTIVGVIFDETRLVLTYLCQRQIFTES
jgi:class 3 adenylate cyclase